MGFRRNMEDGGEKGSLGDVDRLSDLPDCLIHCLMGYLPIYDAAMTSILSKRFRHCWKETPVLKFDEQFFEEFFEGEDNQFVGLMESVMEQVNGPIEELRIEVPPSYKNVDMLSDVATNGFLKLPFHVYNPSHLSILSFKNCYLTDPLFSKCFFSNLVSLRLLSVYSDVAVLEALISRSTKLKDLVLIDLNITGNSPLVVDAPKLKNLEYSSSQSSLCLKYLPCLTSATIYSKIELPARRSERSYFEQFFNLIPKIEDLHIDNTAMLSLIDGNIPENEPKALTLAATLMILSNDMSFVGNLHNANRMEFDLGKITLLTNLGMEVEVQFFEPEHLAEVKALHTFLNQRGFKDVVIFICEFFRTAIILRKELSGAVP